MPRVQSTGSVKVKQETVLPIGQHKLTVTAIKWARDDKNEQIANADGIMALDAHFIDPYQRVIVHRFWLTDAAMWALDNLRRATGVYKENMKTPVSEMIGKECYGIVAGMFYFSDERLSRNEAGEPLMLKSLIPKFSPVVGDILPASKGDPKYNNGVPAGDFLVNKGVAMEEFFTEADRLWMLKQCGLKPRKIVPIPNGLVRPPAMQEKIEEVVKESINNIKPAWDDVNDEF